MGAYVRKNVVTVTDAVTTTTPEATLIPLYLIKLLLTKSLWNVSLFQLTNYF